MKSLWVTFIAASVVAACAPPPGDETNDNATIGTEQSALGFPFPIFSLPHPVSAVCANTSYGIGGTSKPWPSDWLTRFQDTSGYGQRNGFLTAYPNMHQANYPGTGEVRGTFFVRTSTPTRRVTIAMSPTLTTVPVIFRTAHTYANDHGYVAAFPLFETRTPNTIDVLLLGADAVEFRDVRACDVGTLDNEDVGQMMIAANEYAVRNHYIAAYPTFHSVTDSFLGRIYGIVTFKPGFAEWRDVRLADVSNTCGGDNQRPCASRQCDTGVPNLWNWDGDCHIGQEPRRCGFDGAECCRGECDAGLVCGQAPGYIFSPTLCRQPSHPPPPPPPPPPPTQATCAGAKATSTFASFLIGVESSGSRCAIGQFSYLANTVAEAAGCAQRDLDAKYPGQGLVTVTSGQLQQGTFHKIDPSGPYGSCQSQLLDAFSDDKMKACARAWGFDPDAEKGPCP